MKRKRLGEILFERGQISEADLIKAIKEQQGKVIHLGELLLQRGMVSKKDLAAAVADVSRIEYVDCSEVEVEPSVLKLIPEETARSRCAIPLEVRGTKIVVAMAEPQDLQTIDELRFKTGMEVVPRLSFRTDIERALNRYFGPPEVKVLRGAELTASDDGGMEFISSSAQQRNIEAMREIQAELSQKSRTTPAVRVVAAMIRAASSRGASDIHIEPHSTETAIRFRVDGVLRDHQRVPRALQNTVVSRIKILSDLDIAERRNGQDGRFLVKIADRRIDLRVSTLPTQYGEKVVLRLLNADTPKQELAQLGFPAIVEKRLRRMLKLPQGMILITGPTGSGKSTTLYAALNLVLRPAVNIITVEDPVEYDIPGVNQVQVNTKAGLTFASCLRSALRQDPDVIMLGEIRDKETAEVAIKASQTGHLVLSTLHTNDSASAVTRLLDLGVAGFHISASVTGVIAQRLVRRLCTCHRVTAASKEFTNELMRAGLEDPPEMQSMPNGCDECEHSGYRGRIGVYELLLLNDAIRSAIRSGDKNDEIRTLARHNGMRLMQEYALERVRDGITTLEEVQRVVPFEQPARAGCAACGRELSREFGFCPYCGEKRLYGSLTESLRDDLNDEEHAEEGVAKQ
jgi:type IV pilus assembly protein PilB